MLAQVLVGRDEPRLDGSISEPNTPFMSRNGCERASGLKMVHGAGRPALAILLAQLALGCGGGERVGFRPVSATTSAGATYEAAGYPLRIDGRVSGDVVVWSRGVTRHEDASVVELSVRVDNRSGVPVEVDRARTVLSVTTRATGAMVVPSVAASRLEFPAGSRHELTIPFSLASTSASRTS